MPIKSSGSIGISDIITGALNNSWNSVTASNISIGDLARGGSIMPNISSNANTIPYSIGYGTPGSLSMFYGKWRRASQSMSLTAGYRSFTNTVNKTTYTIQNWGYIENYNGTGVIGSLTNNIFTSPLGAVKIFEFYTKVSNQDNSWWLIISMKYTSGSAWPIGTSYSPNIWERVRSSTYPLGLTPKDRSYFSEEAWSEWSEAGKFASQLGSNSNPANGSVHTITLDYYG